MELQHAEKLLKTLSDGINPLTGEVLPSTDSANQPEIIRALYTVLEALHPVKKQPPKSAPANAGKPWDSEDDKTLCQLFDRGTAQKDLCDYFKRSAGSITSRLVKLGKIENREP